MTKTIKTYVELGDLTGVHLECEHCHSSLTIPFQRLDRGIPAACPNCYEDWGKRENHMSRNDEPIPQSYLRAMSVALKALQNAVSVSSGLKISLEVSGLVFDEKD